MYSAEEIERIHIELTTRCNAACPMCPRNVWGGTHDPRVPIAELSLADVHRMLSPAFLQQIRKISVCGNYGDPIIARDALEILAYFRDSNPALDIVMNTN